MPDSPGNPPPADAAERRAVPAVTVYRVDVLPVCDTDLYRKLRQHLRKVDEVVVPPREGRAFRVPAGDCGANLPPGEAHCYPLRVEVYRCVAEELAEWTSPARSPYAGHHGGG